MVCALLLALFAEYITAQSGETGLVPPVGYCAPYNGKVCKHFLNGTGSVWFNISHEYAGGWLNEQITAGLWDEMITSLKEPCRSAAELITKLTATKQKNLAKSCCPLSLMVRLVNKTSEKNESSSYICHKEYLEHQT
uniref:Uncharacterized protein n=1 Tax=Timema monikensis TaxID=170555 RepID=A0A7R9EK36_9NEOP|nr:unnamed protein product [Timema monikensis]